MHRQIVRFFIIVIIITIVSCNRVPSSDAPYRVLELLQKGGHDEALRATEQILKKAPQDRLSLEVKLILELGDEGSESRKDLIATQKQIEAIGGGRSILYAQATNRLKRVRQQTAYLLGALEDGSALNLLKDLAEDEDDAVRAEAIHALGKLNRPEAKYLLMIHLRDGNWRVRAGAAEALAKLGDASATGQLFRAVDDPDDYARMQILNAVLKLTRPDQIEIYLKAIRSDEPAERIAGALALGKLRRWEAAPVLLELVQDKQSPERLRMAQALLIFGSEAMNGSIKDLLKKERDPQVKALFVDYFQRQKKTTAEPSTERP